MAKSIILMLLTTSLLVAKANGSTNLTREFEFNSNSPHTVAFGLDLLTVSYYNEIEGGQHKVHFNLTSTDKHYKSCIITLDLALNILGGRIQAASFRHKIIVWSENIIRKNYKLFLVDPKTCSHEVLPTLVDKETNSNYFIEPEVITRQDRFDIFYASQTECSPCTFDSNGNKIETKAQLKAQDTKSQFYVRTVGKSRRYVTAYSLLNNSVAVTLFNEALNAKRNQLLDSNTVLVGAAVNSVEDAPYVGIISAFPQRQPKIPIFTVFDSELNKVFEAYPPLLDGYVFQDAFANVDLQGNSYVTLIQKEKSGPNMKITLVRYNAVGRLIGEVFLEARYYQGVWTDWKDQVELISLHEYCLITHTRSGFKPSRTTTHIRCFNVTEKV